MRLRPHNICGTDAATVNERYWRHFVWFQRLIGGALFGIAPLLAAVIFGGWAAYVNSDYGMAVLVRSGLGQGTYALFSTWIVNKTVAGLLTFLKGNSARMIMSFVGSFLVMISIPIAVHHIIRTPEVVNAILPGALWGSGYILAILWFVAKDIPEPTGRMRE